MRMNSKIHLNRSKIWKYDKLQSEFKNQFFYYYKSYHEIYKTYNLLHFK